MVFASGVAAIADIELIVGAFLHRVTGHIALALLRGNIVDIPLARLEVVAHRLRLVGSIAIGKDRTSGHRTGCVGCALGIYGRGLQVDGNLIGLELYILIVDLTGTIEVGIAVLVPHHRVLRLIDDRGFQLVTFFRGIIDQRIRDGNLHRIYRQHVYISRHRIGQRGHTIYGPLGPQALRERHYGE